MKMQMLPAILLGFAIACLVTSETEAQSLWGVDGGSATVNQITGPPVGPCGYPTGPMIGGFPYLAPFVCPTAGPFQPVTAVGDVTVDLYTNNVWVTDGIWVTEFTKAGMVVSSFPNPLPGPLTGLGWGPSPPGAVGGILWITDGVLAAAVAPPPPPGCVLPMFVIPPFPLLITPPPATDIDFDPGTGTLFLTSAAGVITNEVIGGGPGPFGVFFPPCIGGYLDGIAVDRSTGKRLYATDGMTVAYMFFGGAPAPPTFYTTTPPCYPWFGPGPISGLAFDAAPISYGQGSDPSGVLPLPVAGAIGQAISPNPAFALTLNGAVPGGMAFILVGPGAACPPLMFAGCGILVFPFPIVAGPIPVPITGSLTLPAAIPGGFGYMGLSVYLQWLIAKPAGGFQTTQGLEMTLAMP